jgi:dolichol-phosphate mannosyltransferase
MSEGSARPTVVTGVSGFIGANLAAALAARGARVIGIQGPSGVDWRTSSLQGVELVRFNLCDEAAVRAFLRDVQPVAIYNCAAYGAYSVQTDARRIFDVNVQAVRHMLEGVRGLPGFRAFVQAGSSSEYGFNCSAPAEDAPCWPDSDYAVSKIGATSLLRLYARKHGVPAFTLRLYSVYGPFEDFSRLVPALLLNAREGRLPPLVNPNTSRDFVYVDDAVRAFDAVVQRAPKLEPGAVFNIGGGTPTTLATRVAAVRDVFRIEAEPTWGSMPDRSWDHSGWYADPRRAAAELEWRSSTSLRDGLAAAMSWIERNPALVAEGRMKTVVEVRS